MKKIFESFSEIADAFLAGEAWTHRLSEHSPDECYPWQHGVQEFAAFLDSCGVELIQNPEIYPALFKEIRRYKPGKYMPPANYWLRDKLCSACREIVESATRKEGE